MSLRSESLQFSLRMSAAAYKFENGPQIIRSQSEARERGLNCQSFVHLYYKDVMNIPLPENYLSQEIYLDDTLFPHISVDKDLKIGDVLFFGKNEEEDFKKLHMAVYIGHDQIAHKTVVKDETIWQIDNIGQLKQHEKLHAIKRHYSNYESAQIEVFPDAA